MKRLLIAVLIITGFIAVKAQELSEAPPTMLNYSTLEKKLAKSDDAIQNPKKAAKAKTWFKRGELLQDIHDVNIEFLTLGMSKSEAQIMKGEPKEVRTAADGREQDVYERVILIYEDGSLVDWNETQTITDDPLPMAVEAYEKAKQLDEKAKLDKKLLDNLDRLKRQVETDAILNYTRKKYADALGDFELILQADANPVYEGYIDSVVVYNAALAARNAGMHEEAAKYFDWATDINYGGSDAFYLLKQEYITLKDSASALQTLQRGYEMYPDTSILLLELVNFYLTSGNLEEGLKYLELAQASESDNPSIFFAKGTIYERMGEPDKAMQEYQQSIGVDPDYYNSWYNIGALYYNRAVEMYDDANTKTDPAEYEKAKAMADEELRKAIAPMQRAAELSPDDPAPFQTLKTIYYRLQDTEKYDEMNRILEKMGQ